MASEKKDDKRLRVQGDIDEVCTVLLRTLAHCKGEKAKANGIAIAILEDFISSPEFMKRLETAIRWATQENRQKAIDELKKVGITPPKLLNLDD